MGSASSFTPNGKFLKEIERVKVLKRLRRLLAKKINSHTRNLFFTDFIWHSLHARSFSIGSRLDLLSDGRIFSPGGFHVAADWLSQWPWQLALDFHLVSLVLEGQKVLDVEAGHQRLINSDDDFLVLLGGWGVLGDRPLKEGLLNVEEF